MTTTTTINQDKAVAELPLGTKSATWRIDPEQSEARFDARTLWGRTPVTGQVGEVSGTLSWDGTDGHGTMAIATGTLSSGIKLRDHHLRSGEFFDVRNHPEIKFEATEIVADADRVRLRGQLLVRGDRYPFECTATAKTLDDGRVVLEAEAPFDLDQLGMSRGFLKMIPADVTARVRVVLQPEDA